jgi:hypothetical protein
MSGAQAHPSWRLAETQHFEVHYLRESASELDRVSRIAEQAYGRVSERLHFVLGRKVPLVLFAAAGSLSEEQVVSFATSDAVAPQAPHRSRLVLPLAGDDARLSATLIHELTHLFAYEIILPGRGGDGGLPRRVSEGLASYMLGRWSDEQMRLMRELVASASIPALSQLTGAGGFTEPRLNDAIGHAAFDYIERRWGRDGIRRFWDALAVPRVDRTYDAVFDLTPAEFDAAFREYIDQRFRF